MILEFQKEQNKPAYEDITTGDKFEYLPVNINEPLIPFNPIALPSEAQATEEDIVLKRDDLNVVLSNTNILTNGEILTKD
jgi:hypothetical protein